MGVSNQTDKLNRPGTRLSGFLRHDANHQVRVLFRGAPSAAGRSRRLSADATKSSQVVVRNEPHHTANP
ncbi:hypothetical protein Pla123a_48440 [Posidoniimonas polymericola]|uniref:Uncharacterized protein n=1 Tax=Posidoniimonas polymericola TaxID=2528002 RepID=A0A5C5XU68_9BACT|nr:hypothetical protein Pla123a_48440 [Posidoniimonas polymericola]